MTSAARERVSAMRDKCNAWAAELDALAPRRRAGEDVSVAETALKRLLVTWLPEYLFAAHRLALRPKGGFDPEDPQWTEAVATVARIRRADRKREAAK